jgi:hypothetical protein
MSLPLTLPAIERPPFLLLILMEQEQGRELEIRVRISAAVRSTLEVFLNGIDYYFMVKILCFFYAFSWI